MFILFKRLIKSGWINFSRNSGLSIATIFIMVMTISLATSLFLFWEVSRFFVSYLEEKIDISVHFKIDAQETDILDIKEGLVKIPEVRDVKYISREDALENFKQRHKDDPFLMKSLAKLGENPFLAALNIRAWQVAQYAQVARFLKAGPFEDIIKEVDYYQRKPVIERVFAITFWINRVGIVLSLILALIAALIVFNTIKLAILNQREELSVQRLVGASNWFIRWPFLIQGAIVGFFAALICLLIFSVVVFFFGPRVDVLIPGLNISAYFFNNLFFIFLIQVAVGVGLGMISSAIAVKRYLKV